MGRLFFTFLVRFSLFIILFNAHWVLGQTGIRGLVVDMNNKPLPMANVLLLRAKDSVLVKGAVTTVSGTYSFANLPVGNYIITGTHIGYKQVYTVSVTISNSYDDQDAGMLIMPGEDKRMDNVTVMARKPLLEQKIDRLVINVENSITSAGSTALEVLERAPGVAVDRQNGLISINGKNGVVVMMNGKISHMPLAAVMQMLAGMNSGNIEKIELITTPPANLDAEGDAGYINIVLKQNNNYGTNGSYSATLGYGSGWVTQASINFNHRKGSANIFGDLSYSRIKGPFYLSSYSRISNAGDITETYANNYRVDTQRNIMATLGMDFQIDKRTIIGLLLSGYDNRFSQAESNMDLIFTNKQLDSSIRLVNSEINRKDFCSGNINLQQRYSESEKLTINLDYSHYYNNQPVRYFTSYYDKGGSFVYDQHTNSGKQTRIDFWICSLDYSKKLGSQISLETGIKGTISSFTNDITLERLKQDVWVKDESLSKNYLLHENYSAAYASFDIALSQRTNVKIGFRYEYTNSNLGTAETQNMVDTHYGNLFPTMFISHKINENNSVNLSFSRRITRPTFNDLAPFTYYINANTLVTGNPALQPAISNTIVAAYSFKRYLLSLSLSQDDNYITGFQPHTDSITNTLVLSPENLTNLKTIFSSLAIPVNVNSWWTMQYNLTGTWQQVNAIYNKTPIRLEQINYRINMTQSFRLPGEYSIELSGFYQSPGLLGIYTREAYGTLDLGISKKLRNNKGTFIFNVSEIFNSNYISAYTDMPEQNLVGKLRVVFTQRTFKLTYIRSFGKDKLRGKRERSTGDEDEKNRVQ